MKNKLQIFLVLIAFIIGLLLVIQYRTQVNIGTPLVTSRVTEMAIMLKEAEDKIEKLKEEISNLRATVKDYEEKASEGESIIKAMKEEMDRLRTLSGLTPLEGCGVIVTLEDNKSQPENSTNPAFGLVHHHDILGVINELFASGAEAIAVNDQRIVNNSEIRCAGPVILINSQRVQSPYQITAIGDKKKLKNSLTIPGGIVEVLNTLGIKVTVEENDNVSVPAYVGNTTFKYAKIKR